MSQAQRAHFTNRAGVTVELADEAVLIERKGEPPPRAIIYGSIRAVIFKAAGITNGYIQFCTDARKKVDSLTKAISDPNTVVFSKDTNEDFERLRDLVNEKLEARSQKVEVSPLEPAGERASDSAKSAPSAVPVNYRDPNKANHGGALWAIVLGVLFFAFALSKCDTNTSSNTMNVDENLTTTDMNAVGADSNANASSAQTISRFLAMDSNVRASPTSNSRALGKLTRGSQVEGSLVAGTGSLGPWLKLTSGRYAGGYILALGNVRQTPPPSIDVSAAGFRFPIDRTPIYAEPESTSEVLDYTTVGKRVHVYGRTPDGFLEVGVSSDRVGYIPEEALPADSEPQAVPVDENGMPAASAPLAREAAPPTLRNPQFISADDYPAVASARGEEGAVRVMVGVDINGRVTACIVTQSSGSSSLDEATCRLIRSRAVFDPAIGSDGRPTPGIFTKTINWKLTE
jgi:TonB family protein